MANGGSWVARGGQGPGLGLAVYLTDEGGGRTARSVQRRLGPANANESMFRPFLITIMRVGIQAQIHARACVCRLPIFIGSRAAKDSSREYVA